MLAGPVRTFVNTCIRLGQLVLFAHGRLFAPRLGESRASPNHVPSSLVYASCVQSGRGIGYCAMRHPPLLLLAALTWGLAATADVTLTNDFGGSPRTLVPVAGYTDFGSGLPGTPSILPVDSSAWSGAVTSLSVSLLGVMHPWTPDLEIWVANPGGEQSWLMGDAGGGGVQGLDLTFEDGPFPTPTPGFPLDPVTYQPSAPAGTPDASGSPSPAAVFLTDLVDAGSSIPGDWLLFVYGDGLGIGGPGALGAWCLTFKGVSTSGGDTGGGGPGSTSSTPEPSALLLAMAVLGGLAVRRTWRR